MDTTLITSLVLGLALGIRHALDADHVVAVSTIVSHYRSALRAALVGAYWGIGHTLTLLVVGVAVLALKLAIPDRLALWMEFLVGVVLFVLGLQIVWGYRRGTPHAHEHTHEAQTHSHAHFHGRAGEPHDQHPAVGSGRSFLLGMVHGLAGSAALMLLVLGSMRSTAEGLLFILVFGAGSVVGMVVISTLIGLPFALSAGKLAPLNRLIRFAAGALSAALGVFLMVEIGFGRGLFS